MHASRLMSIALAALVAAGCAGTATLPEAEIREALAPTGTLRIGVYRGSHTSMTVDAATGRKNGVSYELGQELAKRLGVPFQMVEFPRIAVVLDALKAGQVDFTVTNASAARAKDMDFTAPVLDLELGYLVLPGSPVTAIADIDRPGIRVGVTQGSTSQATLGRSLRNATLVPAPTLQSAAEMLTRRSMDAYATNKAILFEMSGTLPGSRVLDGRWGLEHIAIAAPKGRDRGLAFLRQFAEDMKTEGVVDRAAERAGLRGTVDVRDR
jgi:polar amino acid transport system substrate-binding protein